jgi:hypothetical protein
VNSRGTSHHNTQGDIAVATDIIAHDAQRFTVRPNTAERSYDVLDGASLVCFFPMTAAGYQRAYETCAELNYREAQDAAVDVADEAAARALADEERFLDDVRAACAALQPQRERPIEAAPDMERRAHVVGGAAPVLRYDWAKFSVGQAGVRAYAVAGRAGRAK